MPPTSAPKLRTLAATLATLLTASTFLGQTTNTANAALDALLQQETSRGAIPTEDISEAWQELQKACEENQWAVAAEKAKAFLSAKGYVEPLQRHFATTLIRIVAPEPSEATKQAVGTLNAINKEVTESAAEVDRIKKERSNAGGIALGILKDTLLGAVQGNKAGTEPQGELAVAEKKLEKLKKSQTEAVQKSQQAKNGDDKMRQAMRNDILTLIQELERNDMIVPLVMLTNAYQANISSNDVQFAGIGQKHAKAIKSIRLAEQLAAAGLQPARTYFRDSLYWAAAQSALSEHGRIKSRISDKITLEALAKQFEIFALQIEAKKQEYKAKLDSLGRIITRQDHDEALKTYAEFDLLKRAYPDCPTIGEDQAALQRALAARLEAQIEAKRKEYKAKVDALARTIARQTYEDAVKTYGEFETLKKSYAELPTLGEDRATLQNAVALRLEDKVKDKVEKIRTVIANKDFHEARRMIEAMEKDLGTVAPDMVSVVKSIVTRMNADIAAAEFAELDKRLESVLGQLSPYGVSVTEQLRAGNTPTFSTVKLITEGRTNLAKARAELEGISSNLAEFAKTAADLSPQLRGRFSALQASTQTARQAIDSALNQSSRALPMAIGAAALALLAAGVGVYILTRRKRPAT